MIYLTSMFQNSLKQPLIEDLRFVACIQGCYIYSVQNLQDMKAHFRITSDEVGTILLKQRRVAKALRWWLRKNGFAYKHDFFCS